jgi:hypothetical protein
MVSNKLAKVIEDGNFNPYAFLANCNPYQFLYARTLKDVAIKIPLPGASCEKHVGTENS